MASGQNASLLLAPTMLTTDPPDHERLRGPVARAFTPRSVHKLEGRMHDVARTLVAPLAGGEPFDVVADLAERLPVLVIAEMLGVGTADLDDFVEWSHGLLGALDLFGPPERREYAAACSKRLHDFFADEVRTRQHRATDDDLIGRLVAANTDGQMSHEEMLSACVLLLLGGNETTTKLIINGVLALCRNPDQLARLAADPTLVPTAVDESLRYDTPVQGDGRVATRDVELAGVDVPKGALVITLLGAANRDPAVFDEPERYDVGRTPNPVLSFGRGVHHCLGANLARLEARAALGELVRAVPSFGLADPDEALTYQSPTFFFHAPDRLAIRAA
jgi:cytochrome P450